MLNIVKSSSSPSGEIDKKPNIVATIENLCAKITNTDTFHEGLALMNNAELIEKITSAILKWCKEKEQEDVLERVLKQVLEVCEVITQKVTVLASDLLLNLVCSCIGAIASSSLAGSPLLAEYVALQKRLQENSLKLEEKNVTKRNPYKDPLDHTYDNLSPPENFRQISIVPTLEELITEPEPFLRPNKVIGSYRDGEHYLDVHFRLLREDFVRPLRRAVQEFMRNPHEFMNNVGRKKTNSQQDSGVRSYKGVTFSSFENYGKEVIFNLPERFAKKTNWNKSKRLLPGCLVMLTCDSMKTALFGVTTQPPFDPKVKNQTGDDLRRSELAAGKLRLTIETEGYTIDKTKPYLLFECEAFFEAYRYNLAILRDIKETSFPRYSLYDHIVLASATVDRPEYMIDSDKAFKLPFPCGTSGVANEIRMVPIEPETWDEENLQSHLRLDPDQYNAWRTALTSKIALIQGPPGTGKTYVGLQIVKTLLLNKTFDGPIPNSPFLIVCYTNHALDQFLELLVQESPLLKVARVGGQSKTPALAKYSLQTHRTRYMGVGRAHSSDWARRKEADANAWRILRRIADHVDTIKDQIFNLENLSGIVDFRSLSIAGDLEKVLPGRLWATMSGTVWLGIRRDTFDTEDIDVMDLVNRLFTVKPKREIHRRTAQPEQVNKREEAAVQEEYDMDELLEHRLVDDDDVIWKPVESSQHLAYIFEDHYSVQSCASHVAKLETELFNLEQLYKQKELDETNPYRFDQMLALQNKHLTLSNLLSSFRNTEQFLRAVFVLFNEDRLVLPDTSKDFYKRVGDGRYETSIEDIMKYPLRFRWALYFAVVQIALELSKKHLSAMTIQLNQAKDRHSMRRKMFDGTILQGVDIIGMTTTGAAKMHDLLEIAGPQIVIVEEAAEVLEAHIITSLTEECKHLILIGDHLQLRPSPSVHELGIKYRLNISLFERLILNGVPLCTLKTQHRMRPEISDLIIGPIYDELNDHPKVKEYPHVKGVKRSMFFITHQELEENDEDLLSKSNYHEASFLIGLCEYLLKQEYNPSQITILTTYNGQMFLLRKLLPESCRGVRVTCVDNYQGEENDIILLSLVRSNMDDQVGFVKIDNRICVALSRARHGLYVIGNMDCMVASSKTWKAIVRKLKEGGNIGRELELSCQRHGNLVSVKTRKDFMQVRRGGCGNICEAEMACGHLCVEPCHGKNQLHELVKCLQQCLKECQDGHQCKSACSAKCPPCDYPVVKDLLCGHQREMDCSKDPESHLCDQEVNVTLDCGHEVTTWCCYVDMDEIQCKTHVEKILPCGHVHLMECREDVETFQCHFEDVKTLPCGHSKTLQCRTSVTSVKCKETTLKTLNCGHSKELKCFQDPANTICNNIVEKELPCGHLQTSRCGASEKCKVLIEVVSELCSHISKRPCHDPKVRACTQPCGKKVSCGHICDQLCHVDSDPLHQRFLCKARCQRGCDSGHPCQYKHRCHIKCFPCEVKTKLSLPCGHDISVKCSEAKKERRCNKKVSKQLPCGHKEKVACYLDPEKHKCTKQIEKCEKVLCRFGHRCGFDHACHEDCPPCQVKETQGVKLPCGHIIQALCSAPIDRNNLCMECFSQTSSDEVEFLEYSSGEDF